MTAPSSQAFDLKSASSRLDGLRQDEANFTVLAQHLKALTGIHLLVSPKNLSLMAARLVRVLERRGITSYEAYAALLERGQPDVVQEFISALTTNTTEFFREPRHFEILTQLLAAQIRQKRAQGSSEYRVWCSASSTGQEVYSIVMTLLEADPSFGDWNLKVLATDIDRDVLTRASRGRYSEAEMVSVPPIQRQRFFHRDKAGDQVAFIVNDAVRKFVTFAPFNLMTPAYPFKHGFDLIFCRNVLIYFERAVSTGVTDRLSGTLRPGGLMFLGHSEVGIVRPGSLTSDFSAVYRKGPA